MNSKVIFCIFLVLWLLSGCGKTLPPEKAAYAGEWNGSNMRLVISGAGSVSYSRRKDNVRTTVNAPIQTFDGNDFIVGIGFLNTTFVVSKPPFLDQGKWKMVVDGVELTRAIH